MTRDEFIDKHAIKPFDWQENPTDQMLKKMREEFINDLDDLLTWQKHELWDQWNKGKNDYSPYFGWCDVEGCENEGCCGGIGWKNTGRWKLCREHIDAFSNGEKQPIMKRLSIEREDSRDKTTGYLPIGWTEEK